MQILTMTKASSRWGSMCRYCTGRIRLGRAFIVDVQDSRFVLHEDCFKLEQRQKERRK